MNITNSNFSDASWPHICEEFLVIGYVVGTITINKPTFS